MRSGCDNGRRRYGRYLWAVLQLSLRADAWWLQRTMDRPSERHSASCPVDYRRLLSGVWKGLPPALVITRPARHPPGGGWPERSGAGRPRRHRSPKGRNGHRATVHAPHPRNPAPEAHPEPQPPGDGPEPRLISGTVGATVLRARAAGLDWPQVEALTDDALEGRLYGLRAVAGSRGRPGRTAPPCTPSAASPA